MGNKLLFIFSIVFCISLLPRFAYGACEDNDLCGNCVGPDNRDGCIWCVDDQTCRNSSSTAQCTNKILYNNECPPPTYDCSSEYNDCVACSSFVDCGWCESNQKCMNGDISGPNNGECKKWQYDFNECTSGPENCGDIQDCFMCTSASTCGWCGESQKCMRGYSGGPVEQICSSASWTFYNFQCEPFIPPEFHKSECDEKHSCEQCNQQAGCGWCQNTQTCMPGNIENPLIGTCSDWRPNCGDRPPGLKDCGDEKTCGACISNPYNCTWCEDTGVCRISKNIPGCEQIIRPNEQCPIPKRASKWWVGIIVVLVLAAVGGGGFYIYKTKFSGPKPPHGSFRLGDQIEDNDVYDDTDDDDVGDDLDNDITETDKTDDFNPRGHQDSLI